MSVAPERSCVSPRNVIVTGGSRGLGLGIARMLNDSGYRVIVIARSPTEAIRDFDFRAFDLSDTAGIPALVSGIRKEYGPVYGLVNNAGLGTSGVLATMPESEIERLIALNVLAPMVLTKYVVRSMMAQGAGRIVNIASIVGFTGYAGLSVYSATKASLIGFTKSLAREVGKLGITVNAVAPGFIATELTHSLDADQRARIARRSALNCLAEIDDVAHAVDYLLSDKARNITGTVMTVDAGNTA
jgi:3-oxoacyl-[acyl-carrier protein] reductase